MLRWFRAFIRIACFALIGALVAPAALAARLEIIEGERFDEQTSGSIDVDSGLGNNLRNDTEIICNVMLEGDIEDGDLERLKQALGTLKRKHPDKTPRLCLSSPGGSYSEGLAIARHLIEEAVGTAVPAGAGCYSACSVIFMGGSFPWKGEINRFLHVGGDVGFHAPFIPSLPDRRYSEAELRLYFDGGVSSITELMKIGVGNEVKRFPPELLAEMLQQGPSQLFAIDTVGKAIRFRVSLYGASAPPAVDERSLCNACVNMKYGAYERYGAGGDSDLCKSPGRIERRRHPKGLRIVYEVAPRGGSCQIDVAQDGLTVTGWMYQPDLQGEWWEGLELSYWFLYPPNTPLAALSRRTSAPTAASSAPAPARAPGSRPSEGSADEREAALRRLADFVVVDYLGHGIAEHGNRPELYAPQVAYYAKGTITREAVMADKRAYYAKWPRRTYKLVPGSLSAARGPGDSLDITFRFEFQVSDAKRSVRGTGATTLGVVKAGEGFLIVRENGGVLSRR